MADFISYTTRRPMRWDTLAQLHYADPTKQEPIIAANPGVTINTLVPAGVTLLIPILTPPAAIPNDNKPPWG